MFNAQYVFFTIILHIDTSYSKQPCVSKGGRILPPHFLNITPSSSFVRHQSPTTTSIVLCGSQSICMYPYNQTEWLPQSRYTSWQTRVYNYAFRRLIYYWRDIWSWIDRLQTLIIQLNLHLLLTTVQQKITLFYKCVQDICKFFSRRIAIYLICLLIGGENYRNLDKGGIFSWFSYYDNLEPHIQVLYIHITN